MARVIFSSTAPQSILREDRCPPSPADHHGWGEMHPSVCSNASSTKGLVQRFELIVGKAAVRPSLVLHATLCTASISVGGSDVPGLQPSVALTPGL